MNPSLTNSAKNPENNVIVTWNDHENWESHEVVQEFLNNENPGQKIMAQAYYVRDRNMLLDFQKLHQRSLSKLFSTNYTLRQRLMDNVLANIKPIINTCDLTQDKISLIYDVNVSDIREKMAKNKIRFDELNKIKDHYDFYNAMTVEELAYLGW